MFPYGNVAIAVKNVTKKPNVLTSNPENQLFIQLFATITKLVTFNF